MDWAAIGIYLFLLLGLGFYQSAKSPSTPDEFILAGRKLSLPAFVATLVATWYGGILGVGENTYLYGIQSWFIFGLPYYVFAILYAFLLAPKIREKTFVSIPEQFGAHYGAAAGIVSAVLIMFLVSPAPYILSLGVLLTHTLGWNLNLSILASAVFSLIYVWKGGFRAVVRTDIMQFMAMFIGFFLLLIFALSSNEGGLIILKNLPEHYFDPLGGHSVQYVIVWFFIAIWTFIDPGFYQRTAAAKTPAIAKKGILISVFLWLIFDSLTITTGLFASALLPSSDAAMAYPGLAVKILPPFIYGIFLSGLFATIMSTIDSFGLLSAITFGRDILLKIQQKPVAEEKQWVQKGLVVMAFVATLLAISIPSVVKLWYVIGSIIIPGLVIPFLMTFSSIHIRENKASALILLPVITASLWFYIGHIMGKYPAEIEPFYPGILVSAVCAGIWKK